MVRTGVDDVVGQCWYWGVPEWSGEEEEEAGEVEVEARGRWGRGRGQGQVR